MLQNNKPHTLGLLFAIMVVLLLAFSGYNGFKVANERKIQQEQALEAFRQWKTEYLALKPIQDKWDATYPNAKDIRDVNSLYKLIQGHIQTNPDKLLVEKIERVTSNGIEVGLSRVCLVTSGEMGFAIEAESPSKLFLAARSLLELSFVSAKSFTVKEDTAKAGNLKGTFGSFCIMVRD